MLGGGLRYYYQWDDFREAAEAMRYREKLDMLDALLTASAPRDKLGVRQINQKVSNLDFEYRSRISVLKQEEEDFDNVWASIHKAGSK